MRLSNYIIFGVKITYMYLYRVFYREVFVKVEESSWAEVPDLSTGSRFGRKLNILYYRAHKVEYVPLYSGLEENEAGAVIDKLEKSKIPYRIMEGGKTITVPY